MLKTIHYCYIECKIKLTNCSYRQSVSMGKPKIKVCFGNLHIQRKKPELFGIHGYRHSNEKVHQTLRFGVLNFN